jgi:hypothetical protein
MSTQDEGKATAASAAARRSQHNAAKARIIEYDKFESALR